jgi:hypothetical protein
MINNLFDNTARLSFRKVYEIIADTWYNHGSCRKVTGAWCKINHITKYHLNSMLRVSSSEVTFKEFVVAMSVIQTVQNELKHKKSFSIYNWCSNVANLYDPGPITLFQVFP